MELTERKFRHWCRLIESHTGIAVSDCWADFARRRMVEHQSFFRQAEDSPGNLQALVDRLLIKETRFFRHPPSFNYVANILTGGPDVPGSDPQSEPPSGFSLWSVGCASGEEAYSLAILSEQLCQAGKLSSPFRLLATDVSQSALDVASCGEYPRSRLKHLNAMQHAWFEPAGDKFLRVRATLKKRVVFAWHNLLDPLPGKTFDVIFCQNLLVYVAPTRRKMLLEKLAGALKPGGRLVLAPGEFFGAPPEALVRDRCDPGVLAYRRSPNSAWGHKWH
ncbi:protein-glutamate O-methyltransferase CheR [uncultured Porticoccus sp.]|uniref:CheR family methyltransferase n=1 Tax=uncultured Porticoccus sp. TaxID=1256050 RepID=UPI00260D6007|nr:protein-glutamate O-methyltransferase CheR [uncultured Porticoccus sp.]